MRHALSLLVFCVLASPLFAGTTLPTAGKPVTIIRQNEIVHVFTAAIDVDYDNIQDPGDHPATWQIIDISTLTTQRVREFPWTPVNVSRPSLSATTDLMYIAVGDSVHAYVASTQTFVRSFGLPGNPTIYGVYFDDNQQALRVTTRPSFTDPGKVLSISTTSNTISEVGVNPQQIIGFQATATGHGFAVVSEGAFGQGDGTVTLFTGVTTTIPVGDTPNHIIVAGDSAYVTVNGSHYVVVIDLNTESAVDTILVGTSGFNGPRESAVKDGRLFVSTYAGDVRIFDVSTGARVGFIQHGPKAEGLAIVGNTLWVTRAMDVNYVAESGVVVYDLDVPTSVTAAPLSPVSPLTVTPSVANDYVLIAGTTEAEPVRFVNTRGEVTSLLLMSSSTTSLSYAVTALPEGAYIVIAGTKQGRFVIVR